MLARLMTVAVSACALTACDQIQNFVTPQSAAAERGGAFVLLEIDAETLANRQLHDVADQMATQLRNASPAIRHTPRGVIGDAARLRLIDPADQDRALSALRVMTTSDNGLDVITFIVGADGLIEARLTPARLAELTRLATAQSIEVIRRRIDPTNRDGVEVSPRGDTQIFVRAPGLTDSALLRRRVGVTGQLTFHLVREVALEDAAAGQLPPGSMLVQPYPGFGHNSEVVERRPRFTGARLRTASAQPDQYTGGFVLAFQLDSEGTRLFCGLTRDYTGQRFAMLLDNQVLTAPTINEPICGGSGQISGNFTPQSASELALMLNAGALPAPLRIIEEGVLPPS